MGYWKCNECGAEIKIKVEAKTLITLTIDKDRKIKTQKTDITKKELLHHFCEKCGNKSYFLEDVAEWIEEE